jgi:hypothetical protein
VYSRGIDVSRSVKLAAFGLLIIGTIGLLVNEFLADWGRAATLTLAILNCTGLAILAVTYFGKKGGQ